MLGWTLRSGPGPGGPAPDTVVSGRTMQRHLLLTLGDDQTSWYKLDFISDLFPDKSGVLITLFYVAPRQTAEKAASSCEGRAPGQAPVCTSPEGGQVLEKARQRLLFLGFPPENVMLKMACSGRGALDEITCEGSGGLYDATVLGRRGLTWMEELVEDSLSNSLLLRRVDFPIWVCRRRTNGEKGVLLCVSDSRHSLRMADHIGFVLGRDSAHPVTILHVGEEAAAPDMIAAATAELTANHFPPELIRTAVRPGKNVAKAILDEAHSGHYMAVAVGMSGAEANPLEALFPVHMCFKLLKKLESPALWVSR